MMGTGTHGAGWWILKIMWFVVGSFVFSWIFWKTKQMVEEKPKKKKR
jgi:Na+/melibiose symporter-like transporter